MRFDLTFAEQSDIEDKLSAFRSKFHIPKFGTEEAIYLTGNSLGLQPKNVQDYLNIELEDWAKYGVDGHFEARYPWYFYHEFISPLLTKIVGANESEVVAMNTLTTNLHLLLISFYRPSGKRNKIICEGQAFPSDLYMLSSQVELHGLDPSKNIIYLTPRDGEHHVRQEDIEIEIRKCGDELALVLLGGVNYYSGQVFNMKSITQIGHEVGAKVGFDLAHAVGNVELFLHEWDVDFAAWCSYKYLNSGPGGVAGIFIHEKHATNTSLPRLSGWWGHDKDNRFKMEKEFKAIPTAEGWQLSNAPVLAMSAHRAALEIFNEAGMPSLIEKSKKLTTYLEFVVKAVIEKFDEINIEIITPSQARGCQLSLLIHGVGKTLFEALTEKGVFIDWREPNVIRMAPVPLYNSFSDIYRFGKAFEASLENIMSLNS